MIFEYLNAYAAGFIACWATWCALNGKIRDGVIGKILYAVIAISGYAVLALSDPLFFTTNPAGMTMHVAMALAGLRHMFMVTCWPKMKRWRSARPDREGCLRDNRFGCQPGKIERRSERR
ncbi:hypothetical protein [Pseudomonas sp. LP_7_YM]|uniref:hypothetical protein n=1 Tax=Pseudomonas sp. LP_7_YM TaxID=2485137 RepID=UPI0010ECA34C|nr:hypothetical protein [Pseudomonas sp. LP_7_YM]TDV67562.1 hypothetical protein EC915_10396 [Pseudomonas sp. LP_7_YM]